MSEIRKKVPKLYCVWVTLLYPFASEHFGVLDTQAAEKNFLRVRAGYVTPTTDNILLPIAQKQGFLARQGIEVEIIALRGGVQVAQALLSDSLQFAQMASSVVVRSDLSGEDLVMIAGYIDRISYFLVAKPEIKDVKALTSKKIATASISGSVDGGKTALISFWPKSRSCLCVRWRMKVWCRDGLKG